MRPILSRLFIGAPLLVLVACSAPAPGIARGEAIFDTCSPCHGDAGQGKVELEAPPLAGASEWYLAAQLNNFQGGVRGYHYQDAGGLRMRPMSRALTTPEDVQSVIAYITSLPAADPAPTGHGDAQAGAQEFQVCSACHGLDGSGNQALNAPSLLHLPDWYIAASVRKFRDRVRGATPGDIAGATMFPMVMSITDESVENVAAYIQTLGGSGGTPAPTPTTTTTAQPPLEIDPTLLPEGVTEAMVQEGQSVFAGGGICYTCHMAEGAGGPLAPNLSDDVWLNVDGSYASIVELINTGVAQPREHPGAMLPRAGMPLTDDQVAAVAAYVYMLSR